jgi:hypothetical protein
MPPNPANINVVPKKLVTGLTINERSCGTEKNIDSGFARVGRPPQNAGEKYGSEIRPFLAIQYLPSNRNGRKDA